MKVVIQRVNKANVTIDDTIVGKIDKGLLILVGIHEEDTLDDVAYLVKKISQLRIFEDKHGKLNLDIHEINGSILSVSQFTLYANTKKGKRPSFVSAANPDKALLLYNTFNQQLADLGIQVATGKFGQDMQVTLVNDGPITIVIDTKEKN
ncbi:D-aminoacyl-tRNA deacylase [Melissococcus plutonius]|uniref:D-aminoacyl-tRNA deacylase n=1 Tax=Melissococcus plutonius (strain ATCC 35311 / DSM 29964 / CIP 104052 / LMG 20360 / NCIMB 702443) TaxID=940190 RepID=F3YBC8_MELPT|nr:D-aminoacyl-tRNA deacylase [Melissococcus plutonius]AIM25205.1 D-tyrosyl-tRNA(Tyr) deacylase Dtd [Melissococcus plutonius S1]KMT23841.1 D-tyrosyl-tRNA(Tyr) deacylase Dtd [Melissococcus plutonius]KMT24364.1 D-tyrosyl-tRNA(Tyr) deacylase Dtd [Melissococcus plutonius]KMT25937.1 D-tyrosyl-tRNA(Tyr) deacylase Dtd [Melissococcus plutonius]KMT28488.1 D-tyrosyl-tRNA(Tyr) deacylase Dtd [Melissococcus plutonius]